MGWYGLVECLFAMKSGLVSVERQQRKIRERAMHYPVGYEREGKGNKTWIVWPQRVPWARTGMAD